MECISTCTASKVGLCFRVTNLGIKKEEKAVQGISDMDKGDANKVHNAKLGMGRNVHKATERYKETSIKSKRSGYMYNWYTPLQHSIA